MYLLVKTSWPASGSCPSQLSPPSCVTDDDDRRPSFWMRLLPNLPTQVLTSGPNGPVTTLVACASCSMRNPDGPSWRPLDGGSHLRVAWTGPRFKRRSRHHPAHHAGSELGVLGQEMMLRVVQRSLHFGYRRRFPHGCRIVARLGRLSRHLSPGEIRDGTVMSKAKETRREAIPSSAAATLTRNPPRTEYALD
jgi:hypothetical protein